MSTLNTNYLVPTGREEAWRFTPVKKLSGLIGAEARLTEAETFTLLTKNSGVSIKSDLITPASETTDDASKKLRSEVKSGQILEISKNYEGEVIGTDDYRDEYKDRGKGTILKFNNKAILKRKKKVEN